MQDGVGKAATALGETGYVVEEVEPRPESTWPAR
jgi:hypothetical protein